MKDYKAIAHAQTQHDQICREVFRETNQQLVKWGVQDHPLGFSSSGRLLAHTDVNLDLRTGTELSNLFRRVCDDRFKRTRNGTWKDILLEEVFEALAEDDPEKAEVELIQIAAVAVSTVAASRRARGA